MFKSICSDILKIANAQQSGTLTIKHLYGQTGYVHIQQGGLLQVQLDEMDGTQALKAMLSWCSIQTDFQEGDLSDVGLNIDLAQDRIMALIEKVDKAVKNIRKTIPGNQAVFKMDPKKWQNESVNSTELNIIMSLNGELTVGEVVAKTGQSEFGVLKCIHKFHKMGMVTMMSTSPPMSDQEKQHFLNGLRDRLTDMLGPAANMIINEAFEETKVDLTHLSRMHLPELLDSISTHLDANELSEFNKWAEPQLEA